MTDDIASRIGADQNRNRQGPDGLTKMQRDLCDAYLRLIGEGEKFPKRKAALAAGYAEGNAAGEAWHVLRKPEAQVYLAKEMAAAVIPLKVDRSFVLFKAMVVQAAAEADGAHMANLRALELIARHVDVAALIGMRGDVAPGLGAMSIPFNMDALTTDEKRALLELITRAAPGAAPGRFGGDAAGFDRG